MFRHRSLFAVNLSAFLSMIGVGLIVALLPRRIMDLSASITDVGMLASAFAVPNILLQIPVGKLADRFGFKTFIVFGYLLCGLSGLLYFFADTPYHFFGGRFLQGIAEVPIWALAPALLSITYAEQKGRVMGSYSASLHCGLTFGALLSMVIGRFWQGNEPFLLFAGMSILGGIICMMWIEEPHTHIGETASVQSATTAKEGIFNRQNMVVLSGAVIYGIGYGSFITIVPSFLIYAHTANASATGLFFTLFYFSVSIAQLFAGRWSDRWGREPLMVCGLGLAAAGITAFHRCPLPLAVIVLALASLGLGMFCISALAFLNERVGEARRGSISGLFYFCWGGGYFAGPLLLGHGDSATALQARFDGFALIIAIQFVAILIVCRWGPNRSGQRTWS